MDLEKLKLLSREELLQLWHRDEDNEDLTDWANRCEAVRILLDRQNCEDIMHFHFSGRIAICQIQMFAMLVKEMIAEQFALENNHLVNVVLPIECKNLKELYELCKKHPYDAMFYVSTPDYTDIEYYTKANVQIPQLNIMLYLKVLQNTFVQLIQDDDDIRNTIRLGQSLSNTFMFLNNTIQLFFYYKADNNGEFRWDEKYGPCFINLDFIRQYNGQVIMIEHENQESFAVCRKYIFQDYAYQCRFLSFWACLVTVATFPQLDEKSHEVLENLMDYLLKNFDCVYLYDILKEGDCVNSSTPLAERKSSDNTTRIKLFYTTETIDPCEMRLDLPHVDYPYVHLNIHKDGNNFHVPISKEAKGEESDHVFDSLEEALSMYDYFSTICKHSPVAEDRQIIADMKYRVAMFNYSVSTYYYLLFISFGGEYNEPSYYNHFKPTLYKLLSEDGVGIEEAKNIIQKNYWLMLI